MAKTSFPIPECEIIKLPYYHEIAHYRAHARQEVTIDLGKIETDKGVFDYRRIIVPTRDSTGEYDNGFRIEYMYYDDCGWRVFHCTTGPAVIVLNQHGYARKIEYYQHGKYDQSRRFNVITYEYNTFLAKDLTRVRKCVRTKMWYPYNDEKSMPRGLYVYEYHTKWLLPDEVEYISKELRFDPNIRLVPHRYSTVRHVKDDTDPFQKIYTWRNGASQHHRYMGAAVTYRRDGDTEMFPYQMWYNGQNYTQAFGNAGWREDMPQELKEFTWGIVMGSYEE